MNRHGSAIVLGAFIGSAAVSVAAAQAPKSADWVPVDQDVWTLVTEEPQSHFLRAQVDLSRNDAKAAAEEIRRAGTLLQIEEKRLEVSSKQLDDLAKNIDSGKVVSAKEVEGAFNSAVNVLDHRRTFLPVMEGADVMYMDEADYHLAQAKALLNKKNAKASAEDIRRAAAYMKLKALHAGAKAKGELASSAAELEELARKVEDGGIATTKDLDQVFERAHEAMRRVL